MNKRTTDKYFERVVEALNDCEITFSRSPRVGKSVVGGHYDDSEIVIRNLPKTENMCLSLIHEALHHIYSELREEDSPREFFDLLSRELFLQFSTSQHIVLQSYLPKRRK